MMDVAEPRQSVATLETPARMSGVVDAVKWPSTLSGWVVSEGKLGLSDPATIRVLLGGQVIGECLSTRLRPDVRHPYGPAVGYTVTCSSALPPEALALGRIEIVAADHAGLTSPLLVTDWVRGPAFTRLLTSAPMVGVGSADAILRWLAQSPSLNLESRKDLEELADSMRPVSTPAPVPPKTAVTLHPDVEAERRFWFRFESLGRDCTLGLVQRHFLSEPLGLLRFTSIGFQTVITAIESDFEGVGTPEFTRLIATEFQEYMSSDTRYQMHTHTFLFEGDAAYQRLYERQCRKLRYLARNLVEDIGEGSKIFVVHYLPQAIEQPHLDRLASALLARGPGWLLYVCNPSDGYEAGTAAHLSGRLICGRVLYGEAVAFDTAAASWRAMSRQAAAIVDAAAGEPAATAPENT